MMKLPLPTSANEQINHSEYRDNPRIETASLASSALSLHSIDHDTEYEHDDDDDDGLPAYSDTERNPILTPSATGYTPSTTTTTAPVNLSYIHGILRDSRCTIFPSFNRTSGDHIPSGTRDPHYSHDPEQLRLLILSQGGVPPRPYVVFRGSHKEESTNTDTKNKSTNTTTDVTDFHITVPCDELFRQRAYPPTVEDTWHELHTVPDHTKALRGGLLRSRAKYPMEDVEGLPETPIFNEQTLKIWCHLFCSRAAHGLFPYTFTLRRRITDWDTTQLETRLTGMIRQTNYHGKVEVQFPIEHETFTVYSSHWMNYARMNNWIWWSCVLSQLWIITWPVLWLCTGRFEVVHADWPVKKWSDGAPVYASYSEDDWIASWGQAVVEAAFGRRKQVLGRNDVDRVLQLQEASRVNAQWVAEQQQQQQQQPPQYTGNAVTDSVMGFVNGLSNARSQRDLVQGWGMDHAEGSWWSSAKDRLNINVRINSR